jgi:NADH-quinone oxidoreductase subunit B
MSLNVIDGRDLGDPHAGKGFIMHSVRSFIQEMTSGLWRWSEQRSLWPLTFGIKCCAIEMMAFGAGRYDCDRMGVFFRASPRQADLMIVAGPATIKLRDVIVRLYEQMPEPKYVIAFGECAICGGPFWDSYSVINGVDKLIPVDIYVPGCPPRPEQLLLAILKLQETIDARRRGERSGTQTVTMPDRSREELLAQVMAHPTFALGHQSGAAKFAPTQDELAHATPTGQPHEHFERAQAPAQQKEEKR